MITICALVFSVLITVTWSAEDSQRADLKFPPGFKFGVGSSSYQIEGAASYVTDKGESIWDHFTHSKPGQENGDIGCGSYHLWRKDVEMVKQLGVHFYSFSISWPRILPKGFTNAISKEGTKYYSDLIDALLEKGIEPVVTLYHWDLPQRLQDLGGWSNPLISTWFSEYARIVFSLYADRVKTWITINEPFNVCDVPYYNGFLAPGIISPEGSLMCSKHILMAHAKAWRVYDEEFRGKYHGRVSLNNYLMWIEPFTKDDENLAQLARQLITGVYSHPIFSKDGGWPPSVEKLIADNSKKLGYPRSTLPVLSKEEIDLLKGTYDFYAMTYYNSRTARKANESGVLLPQLNAKLDIDPSWEIYAIFPAHPEGIRKQLSWLKNEYGDMPIVIAKNGVGLRKGLEDKERILYFKEYLKQVSLAINKDGVNVTAFTAWSLMDGFEWIDGYETKFGLYEVDFDLKRTPRASAFYYKSIIKNATLDVSEDIRVARNANTQAANTTNYMIALGCVLVTIVTVSVVVWQVRRYRSKKSYTGVQTEELTEREF